MLPKVLLVDDTPVNLMLARTALEKFCDVTETTSGIMALDVLESFEPDVILLDIMMPEMDGFEVCRRLKEDDRWREIPVIFLTALEQVSDIVRGFEMGAVDYITKPFRVAELRSRVKTQIRVKQNAEEVVRLRREHEAFLRHELNNRLMPIKGYADLLLIADLNLNDSHKRMLERIGEQTDDLAQLIKSMKDLEELEKGTHVVNVYPLDMVKLLRDIIENLAVEFEHVSVCLDCAGDAIPIVGDSVLFSGAFHNLIKNAVEHVSVLADEGDRRVQVSVFADEDKCQITIQNGGVPIPPDRLKTFFDKFNTDRSQKSGGTGLGTTYAYWVIRAHHGHITVVSNDEVGTQITVLLPLSQD